MTKRTFEMQHLDYTAEGVKRTTFATYTIEHDPEDEHLGEELFDLLARTYCSSYVDVVDGGGE